MLITSTCSHSHTRTLSHTHTHTHGRMYTSCTSAPRCLLRPEYDRWLAEPPSDVSQCSRSFSFTLPPSFAPSWRRAEFTLFQHRDHFNRIIKSHKMHGINTSTMVFITTWIWIASNKRVLILPAFECCSQNCCIQPLSYCAHLSVRYLCILISYGVDYEVIWFNYGKVNYLLKPLHFRSPFQGICEVIDNLSCEKKVTHIS